MRLALRELHPETETGKKAGIRGQGENSQAAFQSQISKDAHEATTMCLVAQRKES